MTSPDHLGPSHSASEVTIATVSADAAARVASRTPEISIPFDARPVGQASHQPAGASGHRRGEADHQAADERDRAEDGRGQDEARRSQAHPGADGGRARGRHHPGRGEITEEHRTVTHIPGMFPEGGLRREGRPRLDHEEDQRHHRQLADRRHGTAEAWSQPHGRGGSGQHTAGDTSTLVASRTTPDEPAPSAGSVDWAARQGCASAWAPANRSAGTRSPQRRQSRVSARTSASSSASSALVSRPSRTTRAPWTHTSVIAWGDSA